MQASTGPGPLPLASPSRIVGRYLGAFADAGRQVLRMECDPSAPRPILAGIDHARRRRRHSSQWNILTASARVQRRARGRSANQRACRIRRWFGADHGGERWQPFAHRGWLIVHNIPCEPNTQVGLIDVIMLMYFGEARQRTVEEYRHLFRSTDFATTRVLPTSSAFSIVEASPI